MKNVIVVGGGIAGLISAILLSRKGIDCTLIEKKSYPLHRVCGEYISNEAVPFLQKHDLYPGEVSLPALSRLQLSSVDGRSRILPLESGGFGVSRFFFDHYLYSKAQEAGVKFRLNTSVENVAFSGQMFLVSTTNEELQSSVVLGAHGKRSNLDARLGRAFFHKRSPYVGVKHHLSVNFDDDLIALHNFEGGYCGVSRVENNTVNFCYLIRREVLRANKSISAVEQNVLCKNPILKKIYEGAEFQLERPEVINEISFERKRPVDNHLLMVGDAAGMITPLCGNGMAMAIHASKMAAEVTEKFVSGEYDRVRMEDEYTQRWNKSFRWRLFAGRQLQRLFGTRCGSSLAINMALYLKPVAMEMIRSTHGKPFD